MKANAPEKIYLSPRQGGDYAPYWKTDSQDGFGIEYTQTNAFIERACAWLEENVEKHISADGEYTVYYEEMFEDFKKAMKL